MSDTVCKIIPADPNTKIAPNKMDALEIYTPAVKRKYGYYVMDQIENALRYRIYRFYRKYRFDIKPSVGRSRYVYYRNERKR